LGFAVWAPTTRRQHSRTVTRYQTDLTDAEWRVITPHLPKSCAMGRTREWPMREIVNGIFYVMRAGCPPAAERLAAMGDDLPLVRRLALTILGLFVIGVIAGMCVAAFVIPHA
jgi:Putative transposase of IS4/5 family (DUF4096)